MKRTGIAFAIAAFCVIGSAWTQGPTKEGHRDVLGVIEGDSDLTAFAGVLREAGLRDALRGHGPFTLFAPTNEAFARLSQPKREGLLKDKDQLRRVLLYHMVSGRFSSQDLLAKRTVKTFEGSVLRATMKGKRIGVENGYMTDPELPATNGIVHLIDIVLIPPAPDNYR